MRLDTIAFNFRQESEGTMQDMSVTVGRNMQGVSIYIKTSGWNIRNLDEFTRTIEETLKQVNKSSSSN